VKASQHLDCQVKHKGSGAESFKKVYGAVPYRVFISVGGTRASLNIKDRRGNSLKYIKSDALLYDMDDLIRINWDLNEHWVDLKVTKGGSYSGLVCVDDDLELIVTHCI